MERGPGGEVDPVLHARRLVAQRCLYGVDKNPLAVSLARLSLWLVTLARDEPFTFVDHALRHGDALVGLDLAQIRAFHWKPGPQGELAGELIDTALEEALAARQRILALAAGDDTRAKEHLLWDANDALAPVRLLGDLVVGAFFAETKDKAREAERKRRLDLVVQWLESRREPPEELLALQRTCGSAFRPSTGGWSFRRCFTANDPTPSTATASTAWPGWTPSSGIRRLWGGARSGLIWEALIEIGCCKLTRDRMGMGIFVRTF
jgi:hypothetical protein